MPSRPPSSARGADPAGAGSGPFASIEALDAALRERRYFAPRGLTTAIFLSHKLGRPLFLEGEAGTGKTEVAKVLAAILETDLIRLQCYEGLDVHHAVYEWNYARQMMHIRLLESRDETPPERELFGPDFLEQRPLLQAIDPARTKAPVLLVDEVDRADAEFEAYLLEVLSDFQITIPEIGTVKAAHPPVVVVTSNRTREVHDALKRRCLYCWIDYPVLRGGARDRARQGARRFREAWRATSRASSRSCARPSSTSCPASPRRSTGPPPSSRSTGARSTPTSSATRSASSSSTRTTSRRCGAQAAQAIVDRVRAAG